MTEPRTTVYEGRQRRTRAPAVPRPPRIGDVLGMYRLCVEIGSGGMASVYLARCCDRAGVHRFVALKCIRPEFAQNPTFVEMFIAEAKIAAQIHHANVCSVLDFDEHHGTYYLAMELLSGQTLTAVQQQLRETPDTGEPRVRAAVFARILEGACEGLHATHEALTSGGVPLHVVHRDVSPDNLFVTYDGTVKVMDFGVAYTSELARTTRTGIVKGKCSYLAPEVLAGDPPDRRADIWGLGVVAWEMMAQRKLFDQPNDPAILRAIAEMPIPAPSTLRPGLSPLLDEIVLRALERDPAERYQSARELGRMLNRFVVEEAQAVGLAEISEFMCSLFPSGLACTRQLMMIAERGLPPPPRSRQTTRQPATVADAPVMKELARLSALPEGTPAQPARPPSVPPRVPVPTTIPPPPRVARRILMLALLVAAAGAVGAVLACRVAGVESHAVAPLPDFTLEVTPAGTDATGAALFRVHAVRRP